MLHSHVHGAVSSFVCETEIIRSNVGTVTQLKESKQSEPLMKTVIIDFSAICVLDYVPRLPIASG